MKNEDNQSTRRRGSSPPFQETDQHSHGFVNKPDSIGQHDKKASGLQIAMQLGDEYSNSTELNDHSGRSTNSNPEQHSIEFGETPQGKDNELRWQDDGGESGEAV